MYLRLRHFFGFAVLFFLALSVFSFGGVGAFAAEHVIEVSPANLDPQPAKKGEALACSDTKPLECSVQQLVDMAEPGDVVMFMPAETGEDTYVYDDVGEILVTRAGDDDDPITIRGMGGGDDMITLTGKVMFNVKASNIVIRGFRFKDTEVPDVVTMRTAGDDPSTTPAIQYGFPGKTILAHLIDVDSNWNEGDTLSASDISSNGGLDRANDAGNPDSELVFNDRLFVTVPDKIEADDPNAAANGARVNGVDDADEGKISRRGSSAAIPVSGGKQQFVGDAIMVYVALNAMGTVWVDGVPRTGTCAVPHLKNVQVRNNAFENTYLAGVKAGNHSWSQILFLSSGWSAPQLPGVDCVANAHVEIVGNTFTDVGENGPFATDSNGDVLMDSNGNKIAGHGNREEAISLSGIGSSGTGDTAAPSMITDNTIVGGTADAIVLAGSANDAKVVIRNNRIQNSRLTGIYIVSSPRTPARSAEIEVSYNQIVGSNSNRFLTKPWGPFAGSDEGAAPAPARTWLQRYVLHGGSGNAIWSVEESCASYTDIASRTALRRNMMPEVWTSSLISFPSAGSPVSFINDATSGENRRFTSVGSAIGGTDLIRYKADGCYDLGRIKVLNQAGVTVSNNDLGYGEGSSFRGAPAYGVVVEGSGTELEAFTGNNIEFFSETSVKNSGKSLSVEGNYLGERPETSGTGTVTKFNEIETEPLAGTEDAPRVTGPREENAMPDETPPSLVETGDGAPMVEDDMLTLTFDDMLDDKSVPAVGAFTVTTDEAEGRTIGVSSVAISGMTVTLTLAADVTEGEEITVAYDKDEAGDNVIKDDAGLELASFAAKAVENNSTGDGPTTPTPTPPTSPTTPASTGDGGCALASAAGSGVDFGLLLLPLMAFAFAFGLDRKRKGVE